MKKNLFCLLVTYFIFSSQAIYSEWHEQVLPTLGGLLVGSGIASAAWWYKTATPPNIDALIVKATLAQETISPLLKKFQEKKINDAYLLAHESATDNIATQIREFNTQANQIMQESIRPELFKNLSTEKKELLNKTRKDLKEHKDQAHQLSHLIEKMRPHVKINNYLTSDLIIFPIAKPDISNPYPHMRRISALNNAMLELSEMLQESKKVLAGNRHDHIERIHKRAEERIKMLASESNRISALKEYQDELDRREIERHNREIEIIKERKVRAVERTAEARMIEATAQRVNTELASASYQQSLVSAQTHAQIAESQKDAAESRARTLQEMLKIAQNQETEIRKELASEKDHVEKLHASAIGFKKMMEEKKKEAYANFEQLEKEIRMPSVNPELVEERNAKLIEYAKKLLPTLFNDCIKNLMEGTLSYPCQHTTEAGAQ
jgi:hypothetical protein